MNDYLMMIDNVLKNLLQKNIKLTVNSQIVKDGKFILFTHGYFSLNFNIFNSKKEKMELIKLPVPFDFEYYDDEGLLYFDYRIKSFTYNDKELELLINNIKKPHVSKYYDKILTIEARK